MKTRKLRNTRRGLILLEVLLAVAIFGLAAVALVQLIHRIAETSIESQFEMQVINRMENLLEEHGKAPNLRTGKTGMPPDAEGVSYLVDVQPVALQSSRGLTLNDMFLVRVVARWQEGARSRELIAENFRHAPMYQ